MLGQEAEQLRIQVVVDAIAHHQQDVALYTGAMHECEVAQIGPALFVRGPDPPAAVLCRQRVGAVVAGEVYHLAGGPLPQERLGVAHTHQPDRPPRQALHTGSRSRLRRATSVQLCLTLGGHLLGGGGQRALCRSLLGDGDRLAAVAQRQQHRTEQRGSAHVEHLGAVHRDVVVRHGEPAQQHRTQVAHLLDLVQSLVHVRGEALGGTRSRSTWALAPVAAVGQRQHSRLAEQMRREEVRHRITVALLAHPRIGAHRVAGHLCAETHRRFVGWWTGQNDAFIWMDHRSHRIVRKFTTKFKSSFSWNQMRTMSMYM
mmetsp:Transcript_2142/g.6770  ORF Transcript_2142/g.6770 Transcript_2142/m.6770 type:complete len:315 (+) Transcript_2142:364-1308(+)